MCADFFVTEQNSEIASVRFLTNYDNERADRFKERNSSTAYPGPEIHSLEETLSDKIGEFVESVGIDHALLQNASNFSVAHEHQFYLEWLKDLKSVLWSYMLFILFPINFWYFYNLESSSNQ